LLAALPRAVINITDTAVFSLCPVALVELEQGRLPTHGGLFRWSSKVLRRGSTLHASAATSLGSGELRAREHLAGQRDRRYLPGLVTHRRPPRCRLLRTSDSVDPDLVFAIGMAAFCFRKVMGESPPDRGFAARVLLSIIAPPRLATRNHDADATISMTTPPAAQRPGSQMTCPRVVLI
jgi:hypothetical protein